MLGYYYNNYHYIQKLSKRYEFDIKSLVKFLEQSQFWSASKLKEYQLKKINKLLGNVRTPFYFKRNVQCSIKSLNEFRKFPSISKTILAENLTELYVRQKGPEFYHITSGSSGSPLKIISSNISESHRIAHRHRFYEWWGIKPSDRNVLIWGKLQRNKIAKKESLINRIKKKIFKKNLEISVFDINSETVNYYFKLILKFKPRYLRGYTSAIYQLAKLIDEKSLDGSRIGVEFAIVTSEVLLFEHRNYIEKIFKCRVINEYGAAEIGLFAMECPHGSMHVCEELLYLETTENHKLLVTDLHNLATPLIRYDIGDQVFFSDTDCSCGRTLKVIKKIEGRLGDMVRKPNGELISQYIFYYAVKELDEIGLKESIREYKVIQDQNHFDYYIVKNKNYTKKAIQYLEKRMRIALGKGITISFKFVNELPREESGKIWFFKRIN